MTAEERRAQFIAQAIRRARRLDRDVLAQLAALLPPASPVTEQRGRAA